MLCVPGIPSWKIGGVNAVFTMDVNGPAAAFSELKVAVGMGFTFQINRSQSGLVERYSISRRVDEVRGEPAEPRSEPQTKGQGEKGANH